MTHQNKGGRPPFPDPERRLTVNKTVRMTPAQSEAILAVGKRSAVVRAALRHYFEVVLGISFPD